MEALRASLWRLDVSVVYPTVLLRGVGRLWIVVSLLGVPHAYK